MATFNGWTIVPPPPSPGLRSIVLRMNDTVASSRSPYTAMEQVQQWPGADWWEAEIEMPPLLPVQTAAWQAWLASLLGKTNVFSIGDPSRQHPFGSVGNSVPVCATGAEPSAVNLPGATVLVTRGWQANSSRLLLPGDYLQIGYRLHMVILAPVVSDNNGDSTFSIWPSLREQPTDGEAINLKCPAGLFRLAANDRTVSIAVTGLGAVGVKAIEAR